MSDVVPPAGGGSLNEGLRQMAEMLVSAGAVKAVLGAIVSIAEEAIAPVGAVSISVKGAEGLDTWACTSETAQILDETQYAVRQGPVIEAARTGAVIDAILHEHRDDWPELTGLAQHRRLLRVRSIPLIGAEEAIGALNLYATVASPLAPRDARLATILARHAAVAVVNAGTAPVAGSGDSEDELRSALEARERIAEAKGILMARGGVSSEQALDMLRRASQRSNRKLRDVAQELIDSYTSQRLEPNQSP